MTVSDVCAVKACFSQPRSTGKERDSESGLYNFGARHDASSTGRFMTPDWAAMPATVPYADFGDPQTLNLYSYVRNNPTSLYDPDGHCWWAQKLCDAAHDVGQRFDNLFHGEGFRTDQGVENYAHQHNAERRQQEVSGQARGRTLPMGEWLGVTQVNAAMHGLLQSLNARIQIANYTGRPIYRLSGTWGQGMWGQTGRSPVFLMTTQPLADSHIGRRDW